MKTTGVTFQLEFYWLKGTGMNQVKLKNYLFVNFTCTR